MGVTGSGKTFTMANNKKARHDYFIDEVYEAGIVYVMNISPYEQGNRFNVDPLRPRKLLLHKQEIRKLIGYTTQKGMTLVPLNMYINEDGRCKMDQAMKQRW